jgi:hypothetical protein
MSKSVDTVRELNASDVERRRSHFERALANLDERFGATWYPGVHHIDDAMDSYDIARRVVK